MNGKFPKMGPIPNIRTIYIGGLVFLAILETLNFMIFDEQVKDNNYYAAVINIAGRQRMLSQRVAMYSLQLITSENRSDWKKIRRELSQAVALLEKSHNGLMKGDSEMGLSPELPPEVKSIYFEAPLFLDALIQRYINEVKALLHLKFEVMDLKSKHLKFILASASNRLLSKLDLVVTEYQKISDREHRKLRNTIKSIWVVSMAAFILMALFIFYPMEKRIKYYFGKQKEVEYNLKATNKRLKELDNLKSEFITMASHELRTPLTKIIGSAGTLLNLDLTEELKNKYLGLIEAEGKRMTSLVKELLDISKIESGVTTLNLSSRKLTGVIEEALEGISVPEGIKIEKKFPQECSEIMIDADKIKQVIINLVENAVKYTPSGKSITISVNDLKHAAAVSVTDDGPGIESEDLGKVFDKFYRGKNLYNKENTGSGMGLAIAKGIVGLHGGKIWAESELNKGSVFSFSIPKKRGSG